MLTFSLRFINANFANFENDVVKLHFGYSLGSVWFKMSIVHRKVCKLKIVISRLQSTQSAEFSGYLFWFARDLLFGTIHFSEL